MENTLKVGEAARKLGISLDGVYRLLYAGKLEAAKSDGKWVIPAAAIEERMRNREARRTRNEIGLEAACL